MVMRQQSLQRLILWGLILTASLFGCTGNPYSDQNNPLDPTSPGWDATKTSEQENRTLPVLLPPIARIFLKDGEIKAGRLISINPQTQQITLSSGSNSQIPIINIEKITLQGEIILENRNKIVIRGEDELSENTQETWSESITDFKIQESVEGKAEINLKSLPKYKWQGIQSVAQDNDYVVHEMRFDSTEMLTIQVIPY